MIIVLHNTTILSFFIYLGLNKTICIVNGYVPQCKQYILNDILTDKLHRQHIRHI